MTEIGSKQTPRFIIYSDNDPLFHKIDCQTYAKTLSNGANESVIDENGQLRKCQSSKDYVQVVRAKKGGHFAFAKYNDIVCESILNMLK